MNDKILQRYTNRDNPHNGNGGDPEDEDEIEDFGTFGFLRGSRERAIMLELRKKDGNILAIGYGWLERLEFNPSEGITIHTVGRTIQIKGCNLNAETRPKVRLFEALARHRVPWIQEADGPARLAAGNGQAIVESIEW